MMKFMVFLCAGPCEIEAILVNLISELLNTKHIKFIFNDILYKDKDYVNKCKSIIPEKIRNPMFTCMMPSYRPDSIYIAVNPHTGGGDNVQLDSFMINNLGKIHIIRGVLENDSCWDYMYTEYENQKK